MHEALKRIICFAYACMPVNRIEAVTIPTNEPSQRVLRKLHFNHEATLRAYRYFKHNYTDVDMFSLLRSEWPYALCLSILQRTYSLFPWQLRYFLQRIFHLGCIFISLGV